MKKTFLLWIFLMTILSSHVIAQSGNVDSTFGTNGLVLTNQQGYDQAEQRKNHRMRRWK